VLVFLFAFVFLFFVFVFAVLFLSSSIMKHGNGSLACFWVGGAQYADATSPCLMQKPRKYSGL
jgi:hypothetical protein